MHLLCTPHTLAPLGALSAQMLTKVVVGLEPCGSVPPHQDKVQSTCSDLAHLIERERERERESASESESVRARAREREREGREKERRWGGAHSAAEKFFKCEGSDIRDEPAQGHLGHENPPPLGSRQVSRHRPTAGSYGGGVYFERDTPVPQKVLRGLIPGAAFGVLGGILWACMA